MALPTLDDATDGVVVTPVLPTTVDTGNAILGSVNPVARGNVGVAVPGGSAGVVGPDVGTGVEVTGHGADVDTTLNVRVELAV